jgi:hypothetical protein
MKNMVATRRAGMGWFWRREEKTFGFQQGAEGTNPRGGALTLIADVGQKYMDETIEESVKHINASALLAGLLIGHLGFRIIADKQFIKANAFEIQAIINGNQAIAFGVATALLGIGLAYSCYIRRALRIFPDIKVSIVSTSAILMLITVSPIAIRMITPDPIIRFNHNLILIGGSLIIGVVMHFMLCRRKDKSLANQAVVGTLPRGRVNAPHR